MEITEEIKNAVEIAIKGGALYLDKIQYTLHSKIIKHLSACEDPKTLIPGSQVNGDAPKQPIQLEDFIKMLQKKKEEYLKKVSQDAWSSDRRDRRNFTERQVENNVLSSFLRFLIGQTNQYTRLQAE